MDLEVASVIVDLGTCTCATTFYSQVTIYIAAISTVYGRCMEKLTDIITWPFAMVAERAHVTTLVGQWLNGMG